MLKPEKVTQYPPPPLSWTQSISLASPRTTLSPLLPSITSALPNHWCHTLYNCIRLDRKGTPLAFKVSCFNLDVHSSTDDSGSPPPSPPRIKKTPARKRTTTATKLANVTTTTDGEAHIHSDDTGKKFTIRTSNKAFTSTSYLWRRSFPCSKMQALPPGHYTTEAA